MERQIAIVAHKCDNEQVLRDLVDALMANAVCSQIVVFSDKEMPTMNFGHERTTCTNAVLPDECNTIPKVRNYINAQYKQANFNGFLHVVEWSTKINKDPSDFIQKLEQMMDALDYDVWFNTVCDPCNYVYHKYCPRSYVAIDEPQYDKLGTKRLAITSHANTQWIVYNFAKATDSNLRFDEDFTIPMYFIIEFFARRKAEQKDGQLYFMNEYFTVEEEHGVFEKVKVDESLDQEQLKKENAIFTAKNLKHSSDNNVDAIVSKLYLKLKSKFA